MRLASRFWFAVENKINQEQYFVCSKKMYNLIVSICVDLYKNNSRNTESINLNTEEIIRNKNLPKHNYI